MNKRVLQSFGAGACFVLTMIELAQAAGDRSQCDLRQHFHLCRKCGRLGVRILVNDAMKDVVEETGKHNHGIFEHGNRLARILE